MKNWLNLAWTCWLLGGFWLVTIPAFVFLGLGVPLGWWSSFHAGKLLSGVIYLVGLFWSISWLTWIAYTILEEIIQTWKKKQ